jgi:hypothetical protein
MNGIQVEERLNKIARSVAEEYRNTGVELEELVKRASDNHLLSNPEIETMNALVNHMVFKEKFAEDKLATFKISKFENIMKVDRGMNIVEYKVAMLGDPEMQKAAEDEGDTRNIDDVPLTPQNAPLLMEAGEKNVDDIKDLYQARESEIASIKNRVIALLKEGESLDSIYGVLKDTWGEENKMELKSFFRQLTEELKAEGYLNRDIDADEDTDPVEADDDEPLKTAALNMMKIGSQIMLRESAHELIMDKLAEEYPYLAYKLEDRMPSEYYGANRDMYEKVASWSGLVRAAKAVGGAIGNKTNSAASWATTNTGRPLDRALQNVVLGSMVIAGASGAIEGTASATNAIRKRMWEGKLKKKYPELNQIDDDRYHDIYHSLVGLEPDLLKAPYALKEMISAHNQYGTIDQNTVLNLLSSGRSHAPTRGLVGSNIGKMIAMKESLVD